MSGNIYNVYQIKFIFTFEKWVIIQHHNWEANRDRPLPNLPPQAGEGTVGQKTKSPHLTVPSPACGGRLGRGQSLLVLWLNMLNSYKNGLTEISPMKNISYAITALLISSSALAAETSFSGSGATSVPGSIPGYAKTLRLRSAPPGLTGMNFVSSKTEQLQLQVRELDLEWQILQIKQRLLDLQRNALIEESSSTANSNLRWIDATAGKVPPKAVNAGLNNDTGLYICHTDYIGGTHPGQWVQQGCLISYGGSAFTQPQFQVLINNDNNQPVIWKDSRALQPYLTGFYIPQGNMDSPVVGGSENNHPLYICRAMYNNAIHLGKVFGDGRNCNIAIDGSEVLAGTFEVLFNHPTERARLL